MKHTGLCAGVFFFWLVLYSGVVMGLTLQSGDVVLEVTPRGVVLAEVSTGSFLGQQCPVAIEVVASDAAEENAPGRWHDVPYSTVGLEDGRVSCFSRFSSPNGSVFEVSDVWSASGAGGVFRLSRTVTVVAASPEDAGFASRFALEWAEGLRGDQLQYFMPGMWYRRNEYNDPGRGLTAGRGRESIMVRTDRMPLPVFMVYSKRNSLSLTLVHSNPDASAVRLDAGRARVIHEGLRFGALGTLGEESSKIAFAFPGSEGDRTSVWGGRGDWASRNHPVRQGVAHHWEILLRIKQNSGFPVAQRDAWRLAWDEFSPPVEEVDLNKIYNDGLDIFMEYWRSFETGAAGVPFGIYVSDGRSKEGDPVKSGQVKSYALQMGFIGQQTHVGYHMIKYGLARDDAECVSRGRAIIDWWAGHSMTESGIPMVWYIPEHSRFRRHVDPFLRIPCDGVEGVLKAWRVLNGCGEDQAEWRNFVRTFAEWLVENQNSDGSWFRRYRFDGGVSTGDEKGRSAARNNTTHPIPLLHECWIAFRDERFRESVLKAGEYCLENIHRKYQYRGGAVDTANLQDKEGGLKAMIAFMSLFDLTGRREYLEAACQAADYLETFTFGWHLPLPRGGLKHATIPLDKRKTLGLSILTTIPGAVDTGMGYSSFHFYRLYLLTGDEHYLEFARFIQHNTKQTSDWDGKLGYAHPALQTEAGRVGGDMNMRGRSVNVWLPWVTICNINPLDELREAFGWFDIRRIEHQPFEARMESNRRYGRTHGYQVR